MRWHRTQHGLAICNRLKSSHSSYFNAFIFSNSYIHTHFQSSIKIKFNLTLYGYLNIINSILFHENKRIDSVNYMHIHFFRCWLARRLCEQAFYENTPWTKRERKSNGGKTAEDTHMCYSSPIFDIVKSWRLRHTRRAVEHSFYSECSLKENEKNEANCHLRLNFIHSARIGAHSTETIIAHKYRLSLFN